MNMSFWTGAVGADHFKNSLDVVSNNLANIKRLIPITKNFASDDFFAPMEKGEKVYANSLGILDEALRQIRKDCYDIGNGILTVDQAVESFGTKKTQ